MKVIDQKSGTNWTLYHGDCCEVVAALPDNSVHFSVFSPPFSSLYTYSNSERDMGNCKDDASFMDHFGFLVKDLFRVTKPGRLVSFHCMNLPMSKQFHGVIGLRDFRGELIRLFCNDEAAEFHQVIHRLEGRRDEALKARDFLRMEDLQVTIFKLNQELTKYTESAGGWIFHSEVCIWKDPVTAMQRTKALGLLHKQIEKDSCMSRQGVPDYLVTMRKPGVNPEPVSGRFEHYTGGEPAMATRADTIDTADDSDRRRFSIDVWQRYASPVWMDINPSLTLQRESAREHNDERHICPLQLQVIDRALELWSNPGDTVLSPFAGIGSEGHEAIKMGRKFIGVELKASYFKQAYLNLQAAEAAQSELAGFNQQAEIVQ